jgi:hypothetical protein
MERTYVKKLQIKGSHQPWVGILFNKLRLLVPIPIIENQIGIKFDV